MFAQPNQFGQIKRPRLADRATLAAVTPGELAAAIWQHRFAFALREYMRAEGLSQTAVAQRAGIGPSNLNQIINGRQAATQAAMLGMAIALDAVDLIPVADSTAALLEP